MVPVGQGAGSRVPVPCREPAVAKPGALVAAAGEADADFSARHSLPGLQSCSLLRALLKSSTMINSWLTRGCFLRLVCWNKQSPAGCGGKGE